MAEKTHQGLPNGTPHQFVHSNPNVPQNTYFPQHAPATQHSPAFGHSQDANEATKPSPLLMMNGQASPLNMRNPSLQLHSGQLINNMPSNPNEHQPSQRIPNMPQGLQAIHPQQQVLRPTISPGMINSKVMQPNTAQHQSQQNILPGNSSPMNSNIESSGKGGGPNYSSNVPLTRTMQPSPVIVNNGSIPTSGGPVQTQLGFHPNSSVPQHSQYQQINKVNVQPPSQQPPLRPPTSNPPNLSAVGPPRPLGGPGIGPSPLHRPPVNASYQNYPPQSNSELNPSPMHHAVVPNSHPSPLQMNKPPMNPQFSSATQQTFPPTGMPPPPPSQVNRTPGSAAYPRPQQPMGYPLQQQLDNTSYSQPQSEQGTPTYPSQMTPNRNIIGPPPIGGLQQAPNNVPRPSDMNRRPSGNSGYTDQRYPGVNNMTASFDRMSVTQQGYNKLWGVETLDLLQCRNVLPPEKVTPPPIKLQQEFLNSVNCSPEIFCSTMNKIPETNSLLQKSRLPLGILIHPFRDLSQLAVIQCSSIVRCRACRTYINPFVYFVDNKRWKCNLCFRVNELPDEFQYDPVSKTYGDPSRRPEIKSSTIEFIAPSEYMLRPPQPAIYLFVLDISRTGCDTGYLETLCQVLLEELSNLPGDNRTQVGFILFDSCVHFFSIAENYNQAHEMIVTDIDDVFLPTPDSLLVNLKENRQLIEDLLHELPRKYSESYDSDSALGPALQAAYKLMNPTGGRITVFQSCIPNKGPGALNSREDPNQRSSKDVRHLGPQTDFYKRLSLECSTQQISVDLFLVSSQYSDLSTLGCISQFSGGCIYHFPLYRKTNVELNERLTRALRRYLTRKIGFEAVMRVRCSRGLSIHTFHGNFFVRSTDLLSLPNVNPDAGFGMQVSIEDSLSELQTVCFQAAVLYTSAKAERRIRVHTLCLPVSSSLSDILNSADQQAIIGLLAKMAVDRSLKSSLSDAREAFINVAIDILSAYKLVETSGGPNAILTPHNLSLIPLYILALLKSTAFRTGQSTRLDDRVFAMSQMKNLPLRELIQLIHPDLYHITSLDDQTGLEFEGRTVAQPGRLSLSSEHLTPRGAFLLDTPEVIYLLVGRNIAVEFLKNIFDVSDIRELEENMLDLPELPNEESEKLRHFINYLQSDKPWPAIIKVITEPKIWNEFLINDKAENALSYYELLHHVKAQMK